MYNATAELYLNKWSKILTKGRIACRAVIEDCMSDPFAAYTAAETPNAFQWAG